MQAPYVFISYRRDVAVMISQLICSKLELAGIRTYLDVERPEDVELGQCVEQVREATHMVLVLYPGTLDRCAANNDLLRLEVATAIERGIPIVPVFMEGFRPKSGYRDLPVDLLPIRRFIGMPWPDDAIYIKSFFTQLKSKIIPGKED